MGRKIPGRKHRGVKDPVQQKAAREESLKLKINAPPSNPDEQEMPKSITNLIRLKELAKKSDFKQKKAKKKKYQLLNTSNYTSNDRRLPGMKRPDKVMPSLTQLCGESDESFMDRVNDATETIIKEVEFEQQFGVNVKRNQKSGAIECIENAEPDELELLSKAKTENPKAEKRRRKKKLKKDQMNFLNSKERRKEKEKLKKSELRKDKEDKEMLQDHIKFGEVVHQPPRFTARPRYATSDTFGKPGLKNNLLLNGLFASGSKNKSKLINMSMPAKQKMEQQRIDAVEAYRNLKAQRRKKS